MTPTVRSATATVVIDDGTEEGCRLTFELDSVDHPIEFEFSSRADVIDTSDQYDDGTVHRELGGRWTHTVHLVGRGPAQTGTPTGESDAAS
jgi:hypothetical protein